MTLPADFLKRPIAHRALHDLRVGRPENSLSAVRAARDAGYGIEIDLQLSRDGVAMVFHDYDLKRLAGQNGPIRQQSAADLAQLTLLGSEEAVPTLAQVLNAVDRQVPILIELKDQDGGMGPNIGALEKAVAQDVHDYGGPVALMSFNPYSVAYLHELLPDIPRGLTTDGFEQASWPTLSAARQEELRRIPDYDRTGASFISHNWRDLERGRVSDLKKQGATVLCWTVRSPEEEAKARQIAQNITFEGYAA